MTDWTQKPLASIGGDLPVELLAATGRYAGPLPFDADRPTPRAGAWLESKFAPWAFQLLEDWANGALDHLDAVVFSRGDDSAQRLYYYVCELQRQGAIAGPRALVFDIAHIRRASSLDATIAAVRRLAATLGVGETALEGALAVPERPGRPPEEKRPPCVLAGTLPPDRRLHDMVAAGGWSADGDTLPESWAAGAPSVDGEDGDPFVRLGQRLHASAAGPRGFGDRVEWLRTRLADTGARAAILWFCEHDEAEAWHVPAMRRALDEDGVPHLLLTRRDWRATDGVADEIATFLAELPR